MTIGSTIRNRRKQLGITQEQLAQAVYVSPQAVSQWETEKTVPDAFNLVAIAKTLNMSKAELVAKLTDNDSADKLPWTVRDNFYSVDNMQRKLKRFAAEENLAETERAIEFAAKAHAGQLRKASVFSDAQVPYIFHPYAIACHAHALGIHDDTVLATALLHDVCEDCGIGVDELPFNAEVRDAVARLSKPRDKKDYVAEAYYAAIADNSTAAIVKVLDRCNNLSTMMASFTIERVVSYVSETEEFIIPLLDAIKERYPEYNDAAFTIKYQIYSTIESVKAAVMRL